MWTIQHFIGSWPHTDHWIFTNVEKRYGTCCRQVRTRTPSLAMLQLLAAVKCQLRNSSFRFYSEQSYAPYVQHISHVRCSLAVP